MLRQHLSDAHGARCSQASAALGADEYVALGCKERLQALLTLVDDCLQVSTVTTCEHETYLTQCIN